MISTEPSFLDELVVSPMRDGYTWFLTERFRYSGGLVRKDGPVSIIVPPRFETDFASVPSPFWIIFPKWGTYGPAAVLHDWLYWEQKFSKDQADQIFLEAMKTLRVSQWKTWVLYKAVSWFGQKAWDENEQIKKQGFTRLHAGCEAQATKPLWLRKTYVPRRTLMA